jgi:hypothetical protein
MYSKLLFLFVVATQFAVYAADEALAFIPPSPKRQIKMGHTVAAVRTGTFTKYKPLLEGLKNPLKKISFFDIDSRQSSTITPMQLCIDAIFDRPAEDKLPLIHAMSISLIQRCPKILTTGCYEEMLPYVYAYQKLPNTDSFEPWVPELFTELASNAIRKGKYTHPAMICALTTQILSWDEGWQKMALETLYKSSLAFSHLHHELRRRTQGVNLSNIMLTHGLPLVSLARICVQELATVDINLAFLHCLQLLQSPIFQESSDAQTIKDNLLFWVLENPHIPRDFIAHLLAHEADPYALKPQRGIMTPLQKSLELALKTQGADQLNALTTLQTLLNVHERASSMCRLSRNFVLQKAYLKQPDANFAEDVRSRLREQIGISFYTNELEPFQGHLDFWETIAAHLGGDIWGARCAIYDILGDKPMQKQIEVAASVLGQPLFKRFVLALECERFCMLAAHNMVESSSAFDLRQFLTYGNLRQVHSDDEIEEQRRYTDALYKTLSPETQQRIFALVKRDLKNIDTSPSIMPS